MKKRILLILLILLLVAGVGGYFVLHTNQNPTTKKTSNKKVVDDTAKTEEIAKPKIYIIGDNQSIGDGTYPYLLSNSIKYEYDMYAINGTTDQIAQSIGALDISISQEVQIPEDRSSVEIALTSSKEISLLQNDEDIINPVTIDGIVGDIQYNQETGSYSFIRDESGESKTIATNTVVQTKFESREKNNQDIYIIFTGFNDPIDSIGINETITTQNKIIESLESDRYIMMGLMFKTKFNRIKNYNDTLQATYTTHFLNCRFNILSNDLKPYGVDLNAQDQNDIDNNFIPTSLRSDETTGNSLYHEVLAKMLEEKCRELGYIN